AELIANEQELSATQSLLLEKLDELSQKEEELAGIPTLLSAKFEQYYQKQGEYNVAYQNYKAFDDWFTAYHYVYSSECYHIFFNSTTNQVASLTYAQYNQKVSDYYAAVDSVNAISSQLNVIVAEYNDLIDQRDSIVPEAISSLEEEISNLDSSITAIQNQITTINDYLASYGNGKTVIENAYGGDGNDTLIGNDADNILYGDRGDNILTGGRGADHFVIHKSANQTDIISDFEVNISNEKIDLSKFKINSFAELDIVTQGNDTVINLGDNQKIILSNTAANSLNANNF